MGKTLYLDCPAGLSGDMILAALIDLGLSTDDLEREIRDGLGLQGFAVRTFEARKQGMRGLRLEVDCEHPQPERHFSEIAGLIQRSSLPQPVKDNAVEAFKRLAEAEGRIHGVSPDHVHFHEVGAVDSIVDTVGAMLACNRLGIQRCVCAPLPLGHGTVRCRHGIIPLPAPATVELLKGVPVYGVPVEGETVTPTGAAVVTTLCGEFGGVPDMTIESVGYGLGSKDWPDLPNLLRAFIGVTHAEEDRVLAVESNLDDLSPELGGHLMDRLFEVGALDVLFLPAHMKKNRPGWLVQVLAREDRLETVSRVLFTESTAIGVRYHPVGRIVLPRKAETLETPFGRVQVKKVALPGGEVRYYPEFESCRSLAKSRNVPLMSVYEAVKVAAEHRGNSESDDAKPPLD